MVFQWNPVDAHRQDAGSRAAHNSFGSNNFCNCLSGTIQFALRENRVSRVCRIAACPSLPLLAGGCRAFMA